jgi:hypothetical protein
MTWCACYGFMEGRHSPSPPTKVTPVAISAAVGNGGANLSKDVKTIQNALNQLSPDQGGPTPPLTVNGSCDTKTREAILQFQKVQFPQGHERANHTHWDPDSRIDRDKWTIARLNEILNKAPLLARAREWAAVALDRVRLAIARLFTVRATYSLPNPLFANAKLKREADWCFKAHKVADPVSHLDAVLSVYDRMSCTLHRYLSGSFPLFQLSDTYHINAIAYAYFGGYEWSLDERDPKTREQGAYIYIGNDTFNGPNVIVHELGHYCGGRHGSGREIDHLCTPNPKPVGKPGDAGRQGHNFLTMTPAEALRNVYSYQVFAHAPDGFGPPDTGPV